VRTLIQVKLVARVGLDPRLETKTSAYTLPMDELTKPRYIGSDRTLFEGGISSYSAERGILMYYYTIWLEGKSVIKNWLTTETLLLLLLDIDIDI
jgi:hypothetical protein